MKIMKIIAAGLVLCAGSSELYAWGYMSGAVEVLHVNTYGNFEESQLNGGFCFKLKGHSEYLKISYSETGEKRRNFDFVQKLVLTAYVTSKELKASYVDWGTYPICRVNGAAMPAKWLEDLQVLN
jgi:hypothetical protein